MKPHHLHTSLVLLLLSCTHSEDTFNLCPESYTGFLAGPGCISYIICNNGVQSGEGMPCQEGTLFNEELSLCDFQENVSCETTALPTQRPTRPPTVPPTPRIEPTTPSPTLPPNTRSPSSNTGVEDALDNAQHDINNKLLLYESGFEGGWLPSTVYRYDTMLKALQLMYLEGVGDYRFYLGEDVQGVEGVKIGLVNLAAFLAQSMKETIKYNACDENNWDIIDNKYPLSNACGQLEQSYQDYVCPEGMEHMQCEVDPNMELRATTTAMWYGAPGPLFCGPKTKYPFTGYWDYGFECDFPWKDPPEYCPDYPGQKGGRYDNSEPVENRNNRTDVEGCCWWGRGVIQTTGICNFGILNYYIGKRAADEGRDARYPELDFCKDPGLICSREDHKELKWIAGFFYWMKSVQPYDNGWNYIDNLKAFVQGGMQDTGFIDAVSGIVNRGCHNPPCPNGSGMLDGGYERSENFKKVLEVLFEENGDPRVRRSTESPTMFMTVLDEGDGDGDEGTNFTADISASGTEDQSVEWVNNEEDWSGYGFDDTQSMSIDTGDEEEEEEDWSEVEGGGSSNSNLYCGETQQEAAINCLDEGNSCPNGICAGDLKCYMVPNCGSDTNYGNNVTVLPSPAPINNVAIINDEQTPTPSVIIEETYSPVASLTSPAPVGRDSSASSSAGFDVNDTFFCGIDRADAATSCLKRCRSGSPLECPSGQSCFGYTPCSAELGADDSTTQADNSPSSVVISLSEDTPSPAAVSVADGSNLGITQNYCAKSLDDLAANCAFAITCNDGEPDCPTGQYCWGDRLCVEASIDEINSNPTPVPSIELMLLEETESPSFASIFSTLSPVVQLETAAPVSSEGEQEQQLYCASTIEELEASCSTAQECHSGPCPTGTFCFPFTCNDAQPLDNESAVASNNAEETLCPPTYTGWLSLDCFEYWQCNNGLAGPIQTCPEGKKFDKVTSECNDADNVNEYCYGPPSGANGDQAQENGQDSTELPEVETIQGAGQCKQGRSGWEAAPGCREYYWCDNGRISDTTHDCGENLLFDSELELCNFADQVVCNNMNSGDTVGQAISPPPPAPIPLTPSPVSKKQPDASSNTAGALDDKEWPASTTAPVSSNEETVAEENDEDLPPWLAHVVKDAEADSSARTVLSGYHLFEWLLAFSAVVHYVAC